MRRICSMAMSAAATLYSVGRYAEDAVAGAGEARAHAASFPSLSAAPGFILWR